MTPRRKLLGFFIVLIAGVLLALYFSGTNKDPLGSHLSLKLRARFAMAHIAEILHIRPLTTGSVTYYFTGAPFFYADCIREGYGPNCLTYGTVTGWITLNVPPNYTGYVTTAVSAFHMTSNGVTWNTGDTIDTQNFQLSSGAITDWAFRFYHYVGSNQVSVGSAGAGSELDNNGSDEIAPPTTVVWLGGFYAYAGHNYTTYPWSLVQPSPAKTAGPSCDVPGGV
jgi:hypothetical protein